MADELLKKYTERLHPEEGNSPKREPEATEDMGCFGYLRSRRDRCLMLELRTRSGNRLAIPYSWIESIELDPSTGITILTGHRTVKITGTRLSTGSGLQIGLFEGLARHRVPWVSENSLDVHSPRSQGTVELIQW